MSPVKFYCILSKYNNRLESKGGTGCLVFTKFLEDTILKQHHKDDALHIK